MFLFCMTLPAMTFPAPSYEREDLDRWLANIGSGKTDGLAGLYRATHAAVYGFALSIVKNTQDAEDVLQDTYLQIWQSAVSYRSQGKPMAWILTITRNLALSILRESGRTVNLSPEDWQAQFAEKPAMTGEDRATMDALLSALSDQERQIVVLHALTGLKHREIAALLELPLSTVLSKYNRALKKLRTSLKEAD